jgi:hypothetical protein
MSIEVDGCVMIYVGRVEHESNRMIINDERCRIHAVGDLRLNMSGRWNIDRFNGHVVRFNDRSIIMKNERERERERGA